MSLRPDLAKIAKHVPDGARVLDVGCGEGELMAELQGSKQVDARGMEIDPELVERAVARGLSVIQGDADRDLADYPDGAFDVAILSQTLQTAARPDWMLDQLLAGWPAGLRQLSQLCLLADAPGAADQRPDAGDPPPAGQLV